jgi:polysaccharide biosynthesis transport protein
MTPECLQSRREYAKMNKILRPIDALAGDKHKNFRLQTDDLSPSDVDGSVSRRASDTPEFCRFPMEEAYVGPESRIVFHADPHGPGADRFRHLRMRLRDLKATDGCRSKTLLITSALPQDGKSTVSLNLGTALSEYGKRSVLLIEADLHHPTLTQELRLKPWPGLSDCLEGRLHHLAAIRRVEPLGCFLLPAGEPHTNPSELLQLDSLAGVVRELKSHFDWILMDAPPLTPLTDALSLARHAQASLLVIRAGQTPKAAVEQAVTLLGRKHIVGMVLNAVDGVHRAYSNYYGSSYYYSGKRASTTVA